MTFWLKPWGTAKRHFERLPELHITFPKDQGKPGVDLGDEFVMFAVGKGRLVAVMKSKTGIFTLPDSGPGGKNEHYPFACEAEVVPGLVCALATAPSITVLPDAKRRVGAIQRGKSRLKMDPAEFGIAKTAIEEAARAAPSARAK